MTKKELFRALSAAGRDDVLPISGAIAAKYKVMVIRPAQKTLVMIKVREPIDASLFYLGEMLSVECMVELEGSKGFAVLAGDDFQKAEAAAIIDAALNAEVEESAEILQFVNRLAKRQKAAREMVNAQIIKSKVNFDIMGE